MNLKNLKDWRDLVDLIPENFKEDSQKKELVYQEYLLQA